MAEGLVSYKHAAKLLGVDERCVSSMVRSLGITPKTLRENAMAKALNAADIALLKERLQPDAKAKAAAS